MARSKKNHRRIEIEGVPREPIDETKLALAFWLMAKRMLEEEEAGEERTLP
jgi:hypothetical protein